MTARSWQIGDLEQIAQIERNAFSDPWSKELLSDCLRYPYYHTFLLEEGGQVCGYGVLTVLFEDAEIMNIAVDSDFRGRGLGHSILQAMHERARALGATRALLEVRKSNAPAIALYESEGYAAYGERANYYGDGETALLMEKSF